MKTKSRLTVIRTYRERRNDRWFTMAIAKCECGNIKTYYLTTIVCEHTISCGCAKMGVNKTHGLSGHKLYEVWQNMKTRCENVREQYKRYNKRGISVCKEWLNDFKKFYDWSIQNGWNEKLKIDRKDNNGNYTPSNCRFVTNKINCRNQERSRIIEYNEERITLSEWAERLKISANTLRGRLRAKWPLEKALSSKKYK